MLRLVDRSRSLAFQSCPRKRWWGYEAYGRGIQPIRMSIPLVVGQMVHAGLAMLLYYYQKDECKVEDTRESWIDIAVDHALDQYDIEVKARGFVLDPEEEAFQVYSEQKALIEALIRVWALRRLPGFLEQFEVLEVEREDQFELTKTYGPNKMIQIKGAEIGPTEFIQRGEEHPIIWMSRADGLLRERSTGDLYVLSFKTASEWNDFKDKEARIDMQGMSELYAIEQRLKTYHPEPLIGYTEDSPEPHVVQAGEEFSKLAGVQMEFLLKGRRSRDKETKQYLQDSILVRPYFRDGGGLMEDRYAWKYWTHCEGPHTMDSGKQCKGDANHSLGGKWYRVPVWEHMPVKEWIQLLHEGSVQGEAGDALEGLVVSPMPFFRHEEEIQDWREQMMGQERRVAEAVGKVEMNKELGGDAGMTLNFTFPQHREACFKYGEKHPCQFLDICFGNIGDALESGLYQLRQAHHAPEQEAFDAK